MQEGDKEILWCSYSYLHSPVIYIRLFVTLQMDSSEDFTTT